jgi:hypothetical protein
MKDGSCVFVTENLDIALQRLRHRLDPRWLWADAACVEQTNLKEKAAQIPLMDKIEARRKCLPGSDLEVATRRLVFSY